MYSTLQQPVIDGYATFHFHIERLDSSDRIYTVDEEPTRKPHYQIVWVTQGAGHFTIDLERFDIKDNTIYTIPPGRYHQMTAIEDISGYVLTFNIGWLCLTTNGSQSSFMEEIGGDLKTVNVFLLKSGEEELQHVLNCLMYEYESQLLLRQEILGGLLKVFFIYMKRQSPIIRRREINCRLTRLFDDFIRLVDNQFKTMKQVGDYASELFVSKGYLNDVVKKMSGHSASYHIRQRTVQEAKRLVMYSDVNMKTVAYSLGFYDLSHFSKYFKNASGMNFSDFKKHSLQVI